MTAGRKDLSKILDEKKGIFRFIAVIRVSG